MNISYFIGLGMSAAICTGLFAWKLHRSGRTSQTALLALPLAVFLGLVMAKVCYFLLEFRDQYVTYGLAGLWTDRPTEFSFIGGCVGVVLAVMIAARLKRQEILPVLDAFAPCGALMVAMTRACEGLLDPMCLVGMGEFVSDEKLCFFPIAVENEMLYSWFYAVFMLEAALAMGCALGSFLISRKEKFAPGRVFLHTVFFLALPQIFSERMLGKCMDWGFVRIEQLLCAVIVFAIILYACIKRGGLVDYVPAALCLLCVAVLIWIEFTLDNKLLFGIELSPTACYGAMLLTLCCMAGVSLFAYHRLNKAE